MKTTFKFAGLSALLFGQSLCLLAQTAWHNPAADSLLPIPVSYTHLTLPTNSRV